MLKDINQIKALTLLVSSKIGRVSSDELISALLAKLSAMVFAFLPGALAKVPFLRIGLPAVLSVYFDVFSGCLQAFIFAMLTMLNVSGAFDFELYEKRRQKKSSKNKKTI